MADNTKIEWTDATWNPITGCSVVSAGCRHCYAMKLAGTRLRHHPSRADLTIATKVGPVWSGEVRFNEQWLHQPLQWRRPRKVFVCAHGDLFHENVPDKWIDRVFAVMALAPHHTFQVLTKRPERMRKYIANWPEGAARFHWVALAAAKIDPTIKQHAPDAWVWQLQKRWPLPNVWLGVSVEDQAAADERIPLLLQTPAAVRWISAEPLLGPVDLSTWLDIYQYEDGDCWHPRNLSRPLHSPDWVVVGGESGTKARPMHPDWAYSLADQCAAADVPLLFKQWGEWVSAGARAFGTAAGETRHIRSDGTFWNEDDAALQDECADVLTVVRVGKKAAGRDLGGKLHDGYPEARP